MDGQGYQRSSLFYFPSFEKLQFWSPPSNNWRLWGREFQHGAFCFTNGINNDYSDARGHAKHISQLAGHHKVHFTVNQTYHTIPDLFECGLGLLGIATDPAVLKVRQWRQQLKNKETVMEICTSQGTMHVKNALLMLTPEEQQRMLILAIAPSAYIPKEICRQVWHYSNDSIFRDFVPHIDQKGRAMAKMQGTLIEVASHPDADWFDHSISSPTYKKAIRTHTEEYIDSKGEWI